MRETVHNGDVWRRVSEGSARAECDCGQEVLDLAV